MPMQWVGRMVKGWTKGGESQVIPILCPCNGYEGWAKDRRKVGKARQSPPFSHATGRKGGQRMVKGWESSEKAHPMPIQPA